MTINESNKIIPIIAMLAMALFSACGVEIYETGDDALLNNTFKVGKPSNNDKKVYMHYLSWFGEGENGRHWQDKTLREPLIGYYSSQSWATHVYHILLSKAVGVDGAIINIRTEYDQESFNMFMESIKRIEDIYPDFQYDIAISYDDQDATTTTTTANFRYLKENIIPNTKHYLFKNNKPVIFVWNYDGFLTSQDYRNIGNSVFADNAPIFLKNELDLEAVSDEYIMNSMYPWVQGWAENGSEWGEDYVNWFYNTQIDFKLNHKVEFVTGAVWPGFDDRTVVWGGNRWIDRANGETYKKTWNIINENHKGKIDWVILETWNDFNEGSEIEPIAGTNSFQYLDLTADYIQAFKEEASLIDEEKWMFKASITLYEAARMIEDGERDYNTYYIKLQEAIKQYLKTNGKFAYVIAEEIKAGT